MIRQATRDDVDRIVEMSEKFYPNTRYANHFPMKKENAAGLAILMMQTGTMLVADHGGDIVGMVGAYLDPFTFNSDHMIAKEIVWWVEPDQQLSGVGSLLLTEIEVACKEAGAEMLIMMDLADNPVAHKLYRKRGYYHSENSWTKAL